MESQISNTKRFEQELRLVSYSGIIFFLQHQASLPALHTPLHAPLRPTSLWPRPMLTHPPHRASSCAWRCWKAASCCSMTLVRACRRPNPCSRLLP